MIYQNLKRLFSNYRKILNKLLTSITYRCQIPVAALYADIDGHEMALLHVLQAFRIDNTYPSRTRKNNYDFKSHPYVLPGLWPTIRPKLPNWLFEADSRNSSVKQGSE
jgi:hypothetical protein